MSGNEMFDENQRRSTEPALYQTRLHHFLENCRKGATPTDPYDNGEYASGPLNAVELGSLCRAAEFAVVLEQRLQEGARSLQEFDARTLGQMNQQTLVTVKRIERALAFASIQLQHIVKGSDFLEVEADGSVAKLPIANKTISLRDQLELAWDRGTEVVDKVFASSFTDVAVEQLHIGQQVIPGFYVSEHGNRTFKLVRAKR